MRFGLVRGRSPVVSDGIRWETRSVYSHANIIFDEAVFEAEASGFVQVPSLGVNNSGCQVDLLGYKEPLSPAEEAIAWQACQGMVGELYDYEMIKGFLTRANYKPASSQRRLFCSEAVFLVSIALGPARLLLERIEPWAVPPEGIAISPLLQWEQTVLVP
jgi:hypothetical protein